MIMTVLLLYQILCYFHVQTLSYIRKQNYLNSLSDVVVELPFMVKRVMRGRRPSNELCKQCMRYEYCNEYHFMIGENYCYTQYSVLSIATKAAHRKQISHSCQSLGEVKEELMQCFHRHKNLMKEPSRGLRPLKNKASD